MAFFCASAAYVQKRTFRCGSWEIPFWAQSVTILKQVCYKNHFCVTNLGKEQTMKRASIFSAAFWACASLMTSVPVWASGGGDGGLPQMDASLFPGLLFWLAVTFSLFFIMMKMFGVPAVEETKALRKACVDADLSVARESSDQANIIMVANESALAEARQRAKKTVNDIIQTANSEATEQRAKQQHAFAERFQVAEDKFEKMRVAALNETPQFIDDLVKEITSKILHAS